MGKMSYVIQLIIWLIIGVGNVLTEINEVDYVLAILMIIVLCLEEILLD